MAAKDYPALASADYPPIPKKLEFFHAEEILQRFGVDTRNVQPGPFAGGRDHWVHQHGRNDEIYLWFTA